VLTKADLKNESNSTRRSATPLATIGCKVPSLETLPRGETDTSSSTGEPACRPETCTPKAGGTPRPEVGHAH
jgi:hypothetical protein